MRHILFSAVCATSLFFVPDAQSVEYSITSGSLTSTETNESLDLTGHFDLVSARGIDGIAGYFLRGFDLRTGNDTYLPKIRTEYDGLAPVDILTLANPIFLDDGRFDSFLLRAGGELIDVQEDIVTFRSFEFLMEDSSQSSVVGTLFDASYPVRIQVAGSLFQVDQSYRVRRDGCTQNEPPDTGVIIYTQLTSGASGSLTLIGDGLSEITFIGAEISLVSPSVSIAPLLDGAAGTLPTLEELNIAAPDGADIEFDENGVFSIESTGPITVLGGAFPDLPGLTVIRIISLEQITFVGSFTFPTNTRLELVSSTIELSGTIDNSEVTPPSPCNVITFTGLFPIQPAARTRLATFALSASAADPVEIDVLPGSNRNRIRIDSRRRIRVELLASESLDLRDVDPNSLRLGPAEARPSNRKFGRLNLKWGRSSRSARRLVRAFEVRDLGLAYGDTELCLVAQTYDGRTLLGCDQIDTVPTARRTRPQRAAGTKMNRFLRR